MCAGCRRSRLDRLPSSEFGGSGRLLDSRRARQFFVRVPPGFLKLDVQPIDSDAATHASGRSSLHHDYGWYTGPWSRAQHLGEALSEVVEQDVRIGGRTAQVVSYRSGEVWVVRAWWGRVRVQQGQGEHLLLSGETEDIRIREILLAALYSVRFK
jgi:hypothetical protein